MRLRESASNVGLVLSARFMATGASVEPISFAGDFDLALSFSGCGFLGTYHFGVLSCFNRNGKKFMRRVKRLAGTSAGALVAAVGTLVPQAAEESLERMYRLADELRTLRLGALTPGFLLNERLTKIVAEELPMDISPAQGRLFISVTKQESYENVLFSRFYCREYLIQCLAASCFIPMYSMGFDVHAPRPVIDDEVFIDGGYSNNLPVFDDMKTLTISPFSGSAMIAPADHDFMMRFFDWRMKVGNQDVNVNMQNIVRGAQALFPPSVKILRVYYETGFRDALKFLIEQGMLEREEGTAV